MTRGGRVKRYPEELKQTALELAHVGDKSVLKAGRGILKRETAFLAKEASPQEAIFHLDQRSQYASDAFKEQLAQ